MCEKQGMEDLTSEPTAKDGQEEITRSLRDLPPAHYSFRIENFSLLSNAKIENFESGDFEADGYKWRLSLYPKGNKKNDGHGHLSLYLVLSKSNALSLGWGVNVNFKFFVYNQIQDKYLTIQDANGRVRRFHGVKTEQGFDQLLPLNIFTDPSKGYLVEDCCTFGAEIFVIKHAGKGECLSMMKQPATSIFSWNIHKFSEPDQEYHRSQAVHVGGHNWTLFVYPKGNLTEKGKSLSLYIALEDWATLPCGRTVYAEFTLRVRDQLFGKHLEKEAYRQFSTSIKGWGHLNFMPLDDVNSLSKGYLVNDSLVVEIQFHAITVIKDIS